MAIPIPGDARKLLQAPSYVHLSTPRAGSPRSVSVTRRTLTSVLARERSISL